MLKNNKIFAHAQLKLPVIVAPMFLVSTVEMVIEACEKGLIGSFPALNARTSEELDKWMEYLNKKVKDDAVWAVNFIAHHSNGRYKEDLKLIEKHQPPLVITSLGNPAPVVEIVHKYGGKVFSDVINVFFAKKALKKGADGLILVSSGAGGHGGILNPFAFINEVRSFYDGPLVLAGAISKGKDVLSANIMGANLVYMGTRFIACEESGAVQAYKRMVTDAKAEDILYTDAFSGVHGNYLIPSILKADLDPKSLEKTDEIHFDKTSNQKVKAWKNIWSAGHGVNSVEKNEMMSEIIEELVEEYHKASLTI